MNSVPPSSETESRLRPALREWGLELEHASFVHVAYNAVLNAAAGDNIHDLLADLEKEVKAARDGGVIGSGANDHRRALRKFLELDGGEA